MKLEIDVPDFKGHAPVIVPFVFLLDTRIAKGSLLHDIHDFRRFVKRFEFSDALPEEFATAEDDLQRISKGRRRLLEYSD
jgi:hypothetical protein